nr:hypothetical protein [Chlamydiota bacterium]
ANGFFLDDGTLIVPFRCIPFSFKDGKFQLNLDEVKVVHDKIEYPVDFPNDLDPDNADRTDLCLLKIKGAIAGIEKFEPLPSTIPLKEGMTAYFAGYHSHQPTLAFHKGMISSLFTENGVQYFTIDQSFDSIHSGGPILIQYEGKLYLAGVLMDPEMSSEMSKGIHVEHLSELRKNEGENSSVILSKERLPLIPRSKVLEVLKENGWELFHGAGAFEIYTKGREDLSIPRAEQIEHEKAAEIMQKAQENPRRFR